MVTCKLCTFRTLGAQLSVSVLLCKYVFEKLERKKVYSPGVLERIGRVTLNIPFVSLEQYNLAC